jgi:threonine synthase
MAWQGLINEYRSFFPVTDKTPVITLNEGNTPLIRAVNLSGGRIEAVTDEDILAARG